MKRQKNLEVKKATILAMVVNSLQILMVGVIVLYMYMTPGTLRTFRWRGHWWRWRRRW